MNPDLTGKWICSSDTNYVLEIQSNTLKEIFKSKKKETLNSYTISKTNCDEAMLKTKGTGFYLVKTNNQSLIEQCYSIEYISENRMEWIPARGKPQGFRRIK